jgi:lipooligosaccharide transport system permease protein
VTSALPTVGALRVWRRNLESWKRYAVSFFVAALGEPVFYLLAIGYGLGRFVTDIDGLPYAAFLAPGLIASTAMNTATFETTFGSFTRMTEQNTYGAILATPCSVADVVAGDVLWAATKSTLSVGFVILVTAAMGLVPLSRAATLLPLGFTIGLLFAGLGMVVTACAPSYDFFNYYFTLGISVMFLFSGVFFPLETLPGWAQRVAWFLPLTHAVRAARALARGAAGPGLAADLAWMAVVTLAAFALAERLVRRRLLV